MVRNAYCCAVAPECSCCAAATANPAEGIRISQQMMYNLTAMHQQQYSRECSHAMMTAKTVLASSAPPNKQSAHGSFLDNAC
jgi:hypothetical protein